MMALEDLELMKHLLDRRLARGPAPEELSDLADRLGQEIYRIKNGTELDFWMSARANQIKIADGVVSDRLASSKSGRLRIRMPCDMDTMRELIALCAEGSVSVILESSI